MTKVFFNCSQSFFELFERLFVDKMEEKIASDFCCKEDRMFNARHCKCILDVPVDFIIPPEMASSGKELTDMKKKLKEEQRMQELLIGKLCLVEYNKVSSYATI